MSMSKYRKAIVALAGVALIFLNDFLGLDVDAEVFSASVEGMVDNVIALLMMFGVYIVPNAQADKS